MSLVAVPDLHGHLHLLEAVMAAFPGRDFVFLGDYIDRGKDSRLVLERVLALADAGRARLLFGNHELMALDAIRGGEAARRLWLTNGGAATVRSYLQFGPDGLDEFARHLNRLLAEGLPWLVEDGVLYAHAARPSASALAGSQESEGHFWATDREPLQPLPEGCGLSVHGHTPQARASLNRQRGVCYLDLGGRGIAVYDSAADEVVTLGGRRPGRR